MPKPITHPHTLRNGDRIGHPPYGPSDRGTVWQVVTSAEGVERSVVTMKLDDGEVVDRMIAPAGPEEAWFILEVDDARD